MVPFDPVSYALAKKAFLRAVPLTTINYDVARTSETYNAGEEKTKVELTGVEGFAVIVNNGDGDATIITRVYLNGSLAEEIDGNVFGWIYCVFTSSFKIVTYSATAQTAYCSSINVRGVRTA